MRFLRHLLRDRPFILGLFANCCGSVAKVINAGTIEAEFCSLFCLDVLVVCVGLQVLVLNRSIRASRISRAQFRQERAVMDFWIGEATKTTKEWEQLELGTASLAEKREAEERCRATCLRFERETEAILAKWKREVEGVKVK